MPEHFNVLFLCTGNSARSIMAEAIMNGKAQGRIAAYSAGSHPTGTVRPEALRQVELAGLSSANLRSKSWNEFAREGAPAMDFIFTVCDSAANETCPIWPGHPMTAHWGVPDPAVVKGTQEEISSAFRQAFSVLSQRISLFLSLPISALDSLAIQHEIKRIGAVMKPTLARRVVAEFTGTAFLLAAVVGSGIMGERLAGGNVALALLVNTIATGAALIAIILAFGPISGAHLNPAVTLADALEGGISWRETPAYIAAQAAGALAGVVIAHLMFRVPLAYSTHARAGTAQIFSEFVATFGLLSVVWGCVRYRPSAVPYAVGAYITAAYWFTASTSFANPAVTLARCFTNTFAGIRPVDATGFVIAQIAGALSATFLFRWLVPSLHTSAKGLVHPV